MCNSPALFGDGFSVGRHCQACQTHDLDRSDSSPLCVLESCAKGLMVGSNFWGLAVIGRRPCNSRHADIAFQSAKLGNYKFFRADHAYYLHWSRVGYSAASPGSWWCYIRAPHRWRSSPRPCGRCGRIRLQMRRSMSSTACYRILGPGVRGRVGRIRRVA
jgi:hypothetical protein